MDSQNHKISYQSLNLGFKNFHRILFKCWNGFDKRTLNSGIRTRKVVHHNILIMHFPIIIFFMVFTHMPFLLATLDTKWIYSIFLILALKIFKHSYHCLLVVSPLSGFPHNYSSDIAWVFSPFWSTISIGLHPSRTHGPSFGFQGSRRMLEL